MIDVKSLPEMKTPNFHIGDSGFIKKSAATKGSIGAKSCFIVYLGTFIRSF